MKTNIGHLEAAAGIAGLIKVVLSMQHETLPAHLHCHQPSPHIVWNELPIKVTQQPQPWRQQALPRFAGVSSFGFSGTNAHVILAGQKAEGKRQKAESDSQQREWQLLTLAAKDAGALRELAQRYVDWLPTTDSALADICWSGHQSRSHFSHRLAITAQIGRAHV